MNGVFVQVLLARAFAVLLVPKSIHRGTFSAVHQLSHAGDCFVDVCDMCIFPLMSCCTACDRRQSIVMLSFGTVRCGYFPLQFINSLCSISVRNIPRSAVPKIGCRNGGASSPRAFTFRERVILFLRRHGGGASPRCVLNEDGRGVRSRIARGTRFE